MAFAVGSVALAGVLKAIDLVPPEWSRDDLLTWGFSVAVNAVAAALLFGLFARRYVDRPATPALVVAGLGFLSLAFYWVALPAAFVGCAVFLGLEARGHRRGTAAVAIAAVTLAAALVLAAFGE